MLSDEEITARIADPASIETHEEALEILDCLDTEIAQIQAKIDACSIEFNGRPMPDDRSSWIRRASYAGAMRRDELLLRLLKTPPSPRPHREAQLVPHSLWFIRPRISSSGFLSSKDSDDTARLAPVSLRRLVEQAERQSKNLRRREWFSNG